MSFQSFLILVFPQECPTLFSLRLDRLLKLSETLGRKKRYRGRKEKEIEGKGGGVEKR